MDLDRLILFFVTDLFMCLSPGPVVMAVTAQQLTGNTRGTLGLMGGIHIGNFIWYTMVAFGFITLIKANFLLFDVLQYGGLAFLIYLGFRALLATPNFAAQTAPVSSGIGAGFGTGVAIHMANPKALLFYSVILPPFLDSGQPIVPQIIALAAVTLVTETIGMSSYALAAWRLRRTPAAARYLQYFGKVSGVILILAALILFWSGQ